MVSIVVKTFRLAAFGLGLAILTPEFALAAKPIEVTDGQATSIRHINDYINGFKNLQGDFSQISPKGNVSRGIFFISKPGKMRFEYAPPNPFLIVADGTWLTIKNRAKEKGDQFPLSETPLRLVLGNEVDLLRDTNILGFEEAEGLTTVTLEDKEGVLGGQLILVFDQTQKALQQWVIVDSKGRRTTVSLENIVAGVKPDPQLFVVKINRKDKESK
ncbi:MAG: outer-membrane lipoprotein carrier protein LolA [Rhizobiales bacterium]|nr:outer-membrane lipoprotein carrier protein LolA [Hyphomicrobiales bacterium]